MRHHLVRLLVALFTFSLGLAVAAVSGNFSHRFKNASYRKFQCHRSGEFARSPAMSIDSELSQPLRLLYSSTSIDPAATNRRQVHFIVENQSGKDIAAYAISYRSTWKTNMRGGGGSVAFKATSPGQIMRPGDSQLVSISCDADELLTLWVDSAEFVDGLRWNSERHITY